MSYEIGDFILFRGGEIGKLDAIFIHELSVGVRRLFVRATRASRHSSSIDAVLDIPVLCCTEEQIMIGLPAIDAKKLYIVPVEQRRHGDELCLGGSNMLLYCNWTDIQFL